MAFAPSLWLVMLGGLGCGMGQSGCVSGLISLVHRGAHATGLMFVAPLFAVVAPRSVFAGAAGTLPLVGLAGAAAAARRR